MTEPVQPPELVAVPPYPALGSPTFNVDAYNYGTAMPSVSFNIHQMGQAAYTNAVSAKEKAQAAAQSAQAAAQSAAAADQSAQDATSNGAQQVNLAAQQVALATQKAQDAETARAAAVIAKNAAEAALDSFDDRYLGAKASDPAVDNDGNPLVVGALYFRTGVGMQAWNGTAWVASYLTTEDVLSKSGGKLTGAVDWATPVNVASATSTDIGAAASNRVRITGTTAITSLGTIAAGACRTVTFAGALTLTHNATSLILPGGANITTAAGDVAEFESLGAGNWRCTGYQRADGKSVIAPDVNQATARWVSAPIAASTAASDTSASAEIRNNGGTGDANTAALAFLCTGSYGAKLHLRADGFFGFGGWSRAAWSWYLDGSGNMVAAGNVSAYSDPRLKENFQRVSDPLSILSKLDGGTFTWKHGIPHIEAKAGKRDYGVLADQVEAVMPEIVSQSIDIEGESYRVVSYEKLVPVLIEAVKELTARVEALEAK